MKVYFEANQDYQSFSKVQQIANKSTTTIQIVYFVFVYMYIKIK
jgi:hypothetical protein